MVIIRDRLTPKERILALLTGQPLDRIPSAPLILNHASRVLRVKVSEYNQNGETMGKAHVAAWKRYGHDMILIFSTTSTLAEAMGSKLHFPEDDAPYLEVPVVQSPEDIDKVRIPDPEKDGRLPVYLRALEICNREVGDQVFVGCVFAAPFTTGAALRGTEDFIKETYKNRQLVNKLMELAKEGAFRMIDAILARGGVPVMVEPVASGSLISPVQFEKLVLPHLQEIVNYAHSKGSPIVLHICGKTSQVIELMAESGADVLSLDLIDLGEAKIRVGDRVCLLGNVRPAETLLKGTPEQVREECRQVIAKAADNPRGFILSSGCEVPFNTPPENLDALIQAAREFGSNSQ